MGYPTFIQQIVAQGIQDNPEVAKREVPEILGQYIINNTDLNRVYRCAKNVVECPTKSTIVALAWAIRDAERGE